MLQTRNVCDLRRREYVRERKTSAGEMRAGIVCGRARMSSPEKEESDQLKCIQINAKHTGSRIPEVQYSQDTNTEVTASAERGGGARTFDQFLCNICHVGRFDRVHVAGACLDCKVRENSCARTDVEHGFAGKI